jgi:hypothetical protein
MTTILPCPICGRAPLVDECEIPGTGWHAGCYGLYPYEHYLGVNRDTKELVVTAWNYLARTTVPLKPADAIPIGRR